MRGSTTLERFTVEAPPALATCTGCGTVTAPDGACLEIGACERADAEAARLSRSGATAKFAVPAAWNARGGVD